MTGNASKQSSCVDALLVFLLIDICSTQHPLNTTSPPPGGFPCAVEPCLALQNKYLPRETAKRSWDVRVLHQPGEVWASFFLFCLLWTHLALQLHFWSIYFSHYLHCHPNNLLIFLTLRGHLCVSGCRCYI